MHNLTAETIIFVVARHEFHVRQLQFLLKVSQYDLDVCHYISVCSINWNLTINPP